MALSLTTKVIERMNRKKMQERTAAKIEVERLEAANDAIRTAINIRRIARRNFDKDDIKYYRK